jgi:hypothetical protein
MQLESQSTHCNYSDVVRVPLLQSAIRVKIEQIAAANTQNMIKKSRTRIVSDQPYMNARPLMHEVFVRIMIL